MLYCGGPRLSSPRLMTALMLASAHVNRRAFVTKENVSLKRYFLKSIFLSHRGGGQWLRPPLVGDNIIYWLKMLTGNKFPGMTKAWNALQVDCPPHSLRELLPHSGSPSSPIPSEGCFPWVIDAKVLLIRKNETSNHLA